MVDNPKDEASIVMDMTFKDRSIGEFVDATSEDLVDNSDPSIGYLMQKDTAASLLWLALHSELQLSFSLQIAS